MSRERPTAVTPLIHLHTCMPFEMGDVRPLVSITHVWTRVCAQSTAIARACSHEAKRVERGTHESCNNKNDSSSSSSSSSNRNSHKDNSTPILKAARELAYIPALAASCKGVDCKLLTTFVVAPHCSSILTHSVCPCLQARCNADHPVCMRIAICKLA